MNLTGKATQALVSLPLLVTERDEMKLVSGLVPIHLHPSLYRELKLTFPRDIRNLAHDIIDKEIVFGSINQTVCELIPTIFSKGNQPIDLRLAYLNVRGLKEGSTSFSSSGQRPTLIPTSLRAYYQSYANPFQLTLTLIQEWSLGWLVETLLRHGLLFFFHIQRANFLGWTFHLGLWAQCHQRSSWNFWHVKSFVTPSRWVVLMRDWNSVLDLA